jgi:manganese/zinc/iron transport system substrate-binding protein
VRSATADPNRLDSGEERASPGEKKKGRCMRARVIGIMFGIATALIALVACGGGKESGESGEASGEKTIRIVTTTGMIADAAENVGRNLVAVTGLMGPGVDPHLYKAREGDVSRMAGADVILYSGLHLEGKMAEILEQMGKTVRTAAVTDGIDRALLIAPPEFEGAHDPHVWFDVSLWSNVVEHIRDTLIDFDPEHASAYLENAENYLAELSALHEYVGTKASTLPEERRVIITAHDAFNYFGRAYGFEVRGLQGISTASEAGTADVQSLADFIVERRIPAVFIETSVPPRYIEALRAAVRSRGFDVEIGGSLYSDAMGGPGTDADTYTGMVRHNIDTIVAALSR